MTAELESSDPRQDARQMFQDARDAMTEMKREIKGAKEVLADLVKSRYGDPTNKEDVLQAKKDFQASLKVHVITDGSDPKNADLMTRMYDLYASVFPLEEEREELGKLLGMNTSKDTTAPALEQWILLEDHDGKIIGARNVMNLSAVGSPDVTNTYEGTQSLVYSFVDPKFRSMGLGEYTLQIAEREGRKFIAESFSEPLDPDKVDMLQVAEQNAPLVLSMEAMLVDTEGAKTDQFWRREYYEGLGFRELDFGYVQVPLVPREEGGEPGEGMNLIVRNASGPFSTRNHTGAMTGVPAEVMDFYLGNYAQFVAAGAYDLNTDPSWVEQAAAIKAIQSSGGDVGVKPKLDFNALKEQTWDFVDKYIDSQAFDPDTFSEASIGEVMGVDTIPEAKVAPVTSAPSRAPKQAPGAAAG